MPGPGNVGESIRSQASERDAAARSNGEDYVLWAYRLLLGREPESPDTVQNNPLKDNRQRLVESFLNSREFQKSNAILQREPLSRGRNQTATEEDIFYCFRLLLGRDPNPQEWPGHSSRVGEDLANVVSGFLSSSEFTARGLLNKTYTDAVELVELGPFSLFGSRDDLGVGLGVIRNGNYEPHVASVFNRYIKPGMFVLDVGANIGYFTMLAASLVGPAGRVVAVEPFSENVKLIEASRRANRFDRVTVVPVAAGRKTGILALGFDHLNGVTTEMGSDVGQILASRPVPCVALDDILPKDAPLDFMKIDIEGAEFNALLGLASTLDRCHPIIVSEFAPGMLSGVSSCTGPEYLRFLVDKGYGISVIRGDGSEASFDVKVDGVIETYQRTGQSHIDILALPRTAAE